jgi:hypothetical protein
MFWNHIDDVAGRTLSDVGDAVTDAGQWISAGLFRLALVEEGPAD